MIATIVIGKGTNRQVFGLNRDQASRRVVADAVTTHLLPDPFARRDAARLGKATLKAMAA